MGKILNITIFMLLMSFAIQDIGVYDFVELNDKTSHHIVTCLLWGLRIYTKIEKSSQIKVDLSCDKPINKTNIFYGSVQKYLYIPSTDKKPTIISSNNKYYCTYSVTKDDNTNYGVLSIGGLSPLHKIDISVTVVSKGVFWVGIVIGIIVLIIIIIGVVLVFKKCYRCLCCVK